MRRPILVVAAMVLLFPGVPASQEARFTVHGDGTVTDNATGLMWQQEDDNTTRNWEAALDYCENLVLPPGGYSDWRLPDVKELSSIVDDTRYNPAIDTAAFQGTIAAYYWSSSTYAGNSYNAWYVDFKGGYVGDVRYKVYSCYVRCVR